jgi:hypothetical protein
MVGSSLLVMVQVKASAFPGHQVVQSYVEVKRRDDLGRWHLRDLIPCLTVVFLTSGSSGTTALAFPNWNNHTNLVEMIGSGGGGGGGSSDNTAGGGGYGGGGGGGGYCQKANVSLGTTFTYTVTGQQPGGPMDGVGTGSVVTVFNGVCSVVGGAPGGQGFYGGPGGSGGAGGYPGTGDSGFNGGAGTTGNFAGGPSGIGGTAAGPGGIGAGGWTSTTAGVGSAGPGPANSPYGGGGNGGNPGFGTGFPGFQAIIVVSYTPAVGGFNIAMLGI